MRLNGCKKVIQVGLYLARRMKANLVKNHSFENIFLATDSKQNFPFQVFSQKNLLQALYITDMPTTAAWIDHAFGYYQQVVTVLFKAFRLDLILWEKGFQW